ncbi:MAG: bifunctional oligoribonuclease/PAP phosphatase NrnA [Acidobacteriota bacterium]
MSEATRDPRAALDRLARARRVVITSHSAPDGDALGSELGLAAIAAHLGVATTIVNRDPHPSSLAFLPGVESVLVRPALPEPLEELFDLAVLLECPGLDRPGLPGLDRVPILNIDHHLANARYGEVNYLDEEAPAVGEMVMLMADSAGVPITADTATALYTALVTDTGDFRYSNATPRAFAAAERLVRAGAQPHRIADGLWEHVPARVVRLTAAALATLELLADGRLATVSCDSAMLDAAGAFPEDTENLINIPRSIDGVQVAVMFKAFKPGAVRVSLRSRDEIDVQAVAAAFGGGGHRNAAGCTVPGTLADARRAVIARVEALMEGA